MALVKCKECGNQVSTKAKNCPTCGAKVVKKVGIIGWLFVLVIVLPFAWSIGGNMGKVDRQPVSSAPAAKVQTETTTKAPSDTAKPASKPKVNWATHEYKDPMADETTSLVYVKSLNSVNFDFPYNHPGGSHLSLTFRKKGSEFDAYLRVDKGQMLCGYSNCKFTIRVDGGKVQSWTGLETSSHDSDMMFVRDARSLEKIVKAGKPFRIGIEFYQSGTNVFEFDSSGYPGFK